MAIKISDFLKEFDRTKNTGICILCNAKVQWAERSLASHKRVSCSNATNEEKRLFAKRKVSYEDNLGCSQQKQSNNPGNDSQQAALSDDLRADIDMKVAKFFFRTGISLRLVNSEAFKDLIRSLNPAYEQSIPSPQSLSGSLLDKQYTIYSQQLNQLLESTVNLTLVSDGWTNVRGDHIVNFCVKASGHKPFFYKSIDTTGISQNAPAIASSILKVIDELGAHKFSSVVTDNAPVMKAAWKLIEETYPNISANGCAAHAVNLLIKDISNTSVNAKTIKEAEKVIKYCKNHHIVKAKLDEKRIAAKIARSLSMPVATRWLSLYNAANNLHCLKYVLIQLVDDEYDLFKEIHPKANSKAILDLIKSSDFWSRLSCLIKEIEYPTKVIEKLEADDAPLSLVYYYFAQMFEHFNHDAVIQGKIKNRLDFLYSDSIGLAYLLTPQHAAEGHYFDEDKINIMGCVAEFSSKIDPDIADLVQDQMIAFVDDMSTLQNKQKEIIFKMTGKSYWNIIGQRKYPALAKVAVGICNMICSSATAERVWSTFRFIHSRLRNRLTNERVKKLVFIYINSVLLDEIDKNDYIMEEGALLSEIECDDQVEEQ